MTALRALHSPQQAAGDSRIACFVHGIFHTDRMTAFQRAFSMAHIAMHSSAYRNTQQALLWVSRLGQDRNLTFYFQWNCT